MIYYLDDKNWIDIERLTFLFKDHRFSYYVTEKGNYIGASHIYAGDHPYFLITEEKTEHYQKVINQTLPEPKNEL